MKRSIRIGTRDSQLALWQARNVQDRLETLGFATSLVAVKSTGDLILDKPLYELGITGIFTKTLDVAMINGSIDIAVHSFKDVPTALPNGILQGAVLPRAKVHDLLVHKGDLTFLKETGTIATGSLRRKAQWLHRYPNHRIEDLRGNVNTRLQKLKDHPWDGAIFAAAGLERIDLLPAHYEVLEWMLPAPAQGAMMVAVNEEDNFCREAISRLNDTTTEQCTTVERAFLRTLEGGCTAPIGALAKIEGDQLHFQGALFSLDGKQKLTVEETVPLTKIAGLGEQMAQRLLDQGGRELMKTIKTQMDSNK